MNTIKPTYYVRHPDATYSVADPQPTIQPVKQEPVAWRWETHSGYAYSEEHYEGESGQPLYTTPPTAAKAARQMRDAAVKVCEEVTRFKRMQYASLFSDADIEPCEIAKAIATLPIPGEEK